MEDFLREMLEQIFTSSDTINNIHSILHKPVSHRER